MLKGKEEKNEIRGKKSARPMIWCDSTWGEVVLAKKSLKNKPPLKKTHKHAQIHICVFIYMYMYIFFHIYTYIHIPMRAYFLQRWLVYKQSQAKAENEVGINKKWVKKSGNNSGISKKDRRETGSERWWSSCIPRQAASSQKRKTKEGKEKSTMILHNSRSQRKLKCRWKEEILYTGCLEKDKATWKVRKRRRNMPNI